MIIGITSYVIYQKYFEPMFIIILFTLLRNKITRIFLENKKFIFFFYFYYLVYLSSAVLNNKFLFTKNL